MKVEMYDLTELWPLGETLYKTEGKGEKKTLLPG